MDEARATCALDLSGRAHFVWEVPLPKGAKIGTWDVELAPVFFEAFARGRAVQPARGPRARGDPAPHRGDLLQGPGARAARGGARSSRGWPASRRPRAPWGTEHGVRREIGPARALCRTMPRHERPSQQAQRRPAARRCSTSSSPSPTAAACRRWSWWTTPGASWPAWECRARSWASRGPPETWPGGAPRPPTSTPRPAVAT